ncbi:MAG: DUF2945 domain-containing protein [Luteibacter sp.]
MKSPKHGDTVQWETSQGTTTGKVERKLTSPIKIKGHAVAASKEHPEYLVKSEKTGARAAHKAEALKKVPR